MKPVRNIFLHKKDVYYNSSLGLLMNKKVNKKARLTLSIPVANRAFRAFRFIKEEMNIESIIFP